ncbi:MAG: 2TM domain-containing protein [Stenomitos frigidus ULC029]
MPPRWPRQPDRADLAYRKLDDRMNFATHVAIFAATNSGLWFFRIFGEKTSELGTPGGLPWTPWITLGWTALLVAHAVFIFAIANYSEPIATVANAGTGFKPKASAKATKVTK